MHKRFVFSRGGFTLPTVVISSLLMLAMLAAAVQMSLSTSNSLNEQRFNMLARNAAEAGSMRIQDCLSKGYFVANATVRPSTDCKATAISGNSAYIISESDMRTTYHATYVTSSGDVRQARVVGTFQRLRPDGTIAFSRTYTLRQQTEPVSDGVSARATKRWWYFGSAILNFGVSGTGTPAATANTITPGSAQEGTTVITNKQGQLQFYSNGLKVWNRNNEIMPGTEDLKGSFTATQAVVAFPLDSNERRYAVVTNTASTPDESTRGTLYYSVIDMNLNGGLGGVAEKNKVITGSQDAASEALAAVSNMSGDGFWVYTYDPNPAKNRVLGFELKPNSTSVAVTRSTQFNITTNKIEINPTNNRFGYGSINFSPDNSKMIVYMGGNSPSKNTGSLHMFNVNLINGQLTNRVTWLAGTSNYKDGRGNRGYSADFSPSGRYVYSAQIYPGRLYRYNITSGNATTIKNSEQYIGATNCTYPGRTCTKAPPADRSDDWYGGGQVLRGPNGRMYIANHGMNAISVVNSPDATTVSGVGWSYNGQKLASGTLSQYGLPQMVTSYSPKITIY